MLSIGIIGLPNVGKSTLFNALTNNDILAANYPFATIEPNTGIVPVPDERLKKLARIYGSTKILPATVTFVDIAGLVAGASKGEGLGNKFLANIRQCDAIVHVVRAFHDDDVIHVSNRISPADDIETINTELILADIQTIESKLPKIKKSQSNANDMINQLNKLLDYLRSGTPLSAVNELNLEIINDLHLLTAKPIIYAFNVDENTLIDDSAKAKLTNLVTPAKTIFICAKLESEIKGLTIEDSTELLKSYGVKETGLLQLIHAAYSTLGLQSYLTAGPKEIRAWTIKKGATAPQAAGVIHTDFEKGFIAAQIINYKDLLELGSEVAVKSAGKVRTEGRNYIMQPDDVVEFRFNVSK
ncbi:MAG: ribosome-binding ATPase [Patescibacteria group bacterium]|nr:ribosome-binding ATPase [Patescibacteria group bacterium]